MTTEKMLTYFNENTSLHMGNSLSNDEIDANKQNHQQTRLKRKFQFNNGNLIFFAGTDKARV